MIPETWWRGRADMPAHARQRFNPMTPRQIRSLLQDVLLHSSALLVLLSVGVSVSEAQTPIAKQTTCNGTSWNDLRGYYWEVGRRSLHAEIQALQSAADGYMDDYEARALAIQQAEIAVSLFHAYEFESMSAVREEAILSAVEYGTVELVDGAWGSVWADIVDEVFAGIGVATDPGNPAALAGYAVGRVTNLVNRLNAILDVYGPTVSIVSKQAIIPVLDAYIFNCGDAGGTRRQLGISSAYSGPPDPYKFLAWAAREWARNADRADWNLYGLDLGIPCGLISYCDGLLVSQGEFDAAFQDIFNNLNTGTNRLRADATQQASNHSTTSVWPSTFEGRPVGETQTVQIRGAGFEPGVSLLFTNDTGDCPPSSPCPSTRPVEYLSSTRLRYDVSVGPEEADWTVRVVKDGSASSTSASFHVDEQPDEIPPSAPIGLEVVSTNPSNRRGFLLTWSDPADRTGIVAAYYKVGAPPSFSTDGVRAGLPVNKPLYAEATAEGETEVYVWLEDGAGNSDHTQRASATLLHDATPPTVSIESPSTDGSYHSRIGERRNLRYVYGRPLWSQLWSLAHDGGSGRGPRHLGRCVVHGLVRCWGGDHGGPRALRRRSRHLRRCSSPRHSRRGGQRVRPQRQRDGRVGLGLSSPGDVPRRHRSHLTAIPDNGFRFDEWDGDASGSQNPKTVTMDRNRSVTAVFEEGRRSGAVTVVLGPAEAIAAGAQWRYRDNRWMDSGRDVHSQLPWPRFLRQRRDSLPAGRRLDSAGVGELPPALR